MTYRSALLGASVLMIAMPAFAGPTPPSYVPDLVPPNPVVGECYGRVEIPAQYETTTQRVLTREAHHRMLVQQAELEATTQRILVKEPSVRFVVRQPTYETVTEQVMTRPGFDKLTVSEPRFRTVTETLQTGQPRLIWKRGNPTKLRAQGYIIHSTADAGVGGRGYHSTTQYGQSGGQRCGSICEIWCLVEEPGESVTVTRDVLSHSGQVHRTPVAPRYEIITKQVVADPGGVQKIPVPGEYRNLHVETLVHAGGTAKISVPAEYRQAQGRKLISESRYEWRRVVCKPNAQQTIHHQSTVSHDTGRIARPYVTPHQGHVSASSTSSEYRSTLSGAAYTSGTTPRYHAPGASVAPRGPLQGTLVQTRPAYTSDYRSPHTQSGTTYSWKPNITGTDRSSDHPDRTYSGPAYAHPALSDPRQGQIEAYESRHQPSRTRR